MNKSKSLLKAKTPHHRGFAEQKQHYDIPIVPKTKNLFNISGMGEVQQ